MASSTRRSIGDRLFCFRPSPISRACASPIPTRPRARRRSARWSKPGAKSPAAELTVLTPTGLAAITLALMTATKAGDHVLVSDSAYQPTRIFCDGVLKRFGVETQYYDPRLGAGIADLIRENTSAILTESPGSLSMEVQDVPAIAEAAQGARRLPHPRQHLGDAAVFPAARPWRRSQYRGRHEISLRPRRSHAWARLRQHGLGEAAARDL